MRHLLPRSALSAAVILAVATSTVAVGPVVVADPVEAATSLTSEVNPFVGTQDNGGVHSNSGVPNHAYALVVDGGTYNGQAIAGLGLDKAAAIWWRAQTAYLTPQSNFIDAANAFEQSCVDLVGAPINQLTTAT